jgi:hypothetical protein
MEQTKKYKWISIDENFQVWKTVNPRPSSKKEIEEQNAELFDSYARIFRHFGKLMEVYKQIESDLY